MLIRIEIFRMTPDSLIANSGPGYTARALRIQRYMSATSYHSMDFMGPFRIESRPVSVFDIFSQGFRPRYPASRNSHKRPGRGRGGLRDLRWLPSFSVLIRTTDHTRRMQHTTQASRAAHPSIAIELVGNATPSLPSVTDFRTSIIAEPLSIQSLKPLSASLQTRIPLSAHSHVLEPRRAYFWRVYASYCVELISTAFVNGCEHRD